MYFKTRSISRASLVIPFFILLNANLVNAQTGIWVPYNLESFGSGAVHSGCANACIGYTQTNSRFFLLFDVQNGEWEKVDLQEGQNFHFAGAQGNLVFGWSDDILIAYSSIKMEWDTVHYDGNVLQEGFQVNDRSYGYSNNIAFFVSDQRFYVFDATVGNWQSYDYGLPADFDFGDFFAEDDCIILQLRKNDPYSAPKMVTYSSCTLSFNQLENGCFIAKNIYDHGFAGVHDDDGTASSYTLVGYSALDNQFDVEHYLVGENEGIVNFFEPDIHVDTCIAFTVGFRKVIAPYGDVRAVFYGYSTVLGHWDTITYNIDFEVEAYYGNGYNAGQFTVDVSTRKNTEEWFFYFYNAKQGTFEKMETDIISTSPNSFFNVGGTVFCVYGLTRAKAYSPISGTGKEIVLDYDHTSNFFAGEDYSTFCRWAQGSDMMTTYFYNSITNNWSSIEVPDHWSIQGFASEHIYIHNACPENNVVVYSSIIDEIMTAVFPADAIVGYESNGILADARSEGKSYLFNAGNGEVYEKNFRFNDGGLGKRSAAFFDVENKELYGYSSISNEWTVLQINEEPQTCFSKGGIGLVSTDYNSKIYAFNGLSGNWVGLLPDGAYVVNYLGDSTAIVVRSSYIYAFDPLTETGVFENSVTKNTQPIYLRLNEPNPFYGETDIIYEIVSGGEINLCIYGLNGQLVKTLVDKKQARGEYLECWDGKNSKGADVPAGVYFVVLKSGNCIKSDKLIKL